MDFQMPSTFNRNAPEFQMPSAFNPDAPEFKPVEAMLTLRPEAAEFYPMGGRWPNNFQTASEVLNAYQNKQKRQMPFATDEEWEQRIQKREKEVETIKALQSYRLYIEVFPHDQRSDDDPKTPDPRDRTVSKRMWKWNVEKWRLQLKSRCVYSRAIMLQCREELNNQAAAVRTEGASGKESLARDTGDAPEVPSTRLATAARPARVTTVTVSLPESCRNLIPSGSRRKGDSTGEAGDKSAARGGGSAGAGASGFQ